MQRNTDGTDESQRSRRSVLRVGALAGTGLALGVSTRARAGGRQETERSARIQASHFYPNAQFRVVSGPLEYKPRVSTPEGEAFIEDLYWNEYGTRVIRYDNTGERVLFFPPLDASVSRGERYRTEQIESADEPAEGLVSVGFSPMANAGDSGSG